MTSREETRQEILLAFQECGAKKPVLQITMRDIAAQAGISHSKIFYYYESKEHLLMAYVEYITEEYAKFFQQWREQILAIENKNGMERELTRKFLKGLIYYNNDVYASAFYQIQMLAKYNDALNEAVDKKYRFFRTSINEVLEMINGFRNDELGNALFVLSEGICISAVHDDRQGAENYIDHILDCIKTYV